MKRIMVVNENVYEVTQKIINNTLKMVLEDCKKNKVNMIYALRKDNKFEMTKFKFDNSKEMDKQVKKYQDEGFKVYRASFGV